MPCLLIQNFLGILLVQQAHIKATPLVRCSAPRNCMEFLRRAPTGQHDDIVASY